MHRRIGRVSLILHLLTLLSRSNCEAKRNHRTMYFTCRKEEKLQSFTTMHICDMLEQFRTILVTTLTYINPHIPSRHTIKQRVERAKMKLPSSHNRPLECTIYNKLQLVSTYVCNCKFS